ncbi:DUF305 domain-containing protein [Candidatus Soleaferrea massiliensis]|uniref:DUF305 domain-containing protein n=1 Tax=Candidatus Soleaferrea massiliensis TaxID=1470354 RepID=UPI000590EAE5|nr:DUF305 domain-containing protein [Candidatus Soleaferrea massiliensis]
MFSQQRFSEVTKTYLCRYYEILNEMIAGMTEVRLTDSLSHNFIVQMIPHHKAAIEMSRNLLQYTTFVPLQNIALGIIDEQTKSIADMQGILTRCAGLKNSQQDLCLYDKEFQRITQTMFTQMLNACTTNNINASFMHEMIPHHEGAIRMSQNILRYHICPELHPIVRAIVESQKKGIQKMKRLLQCGSMIS